MPRAPVVCDAGLHDQDLRLADFESRRLGTTADVVIINRHPPQLIVSAPPTLVYLFFFLGANQKVKHCRAILLANMVVG